MSRFRTTNVQSLVSLQEELNRFFNDLEQFSPAEASTWPAGFFWQPVLDAVEEERQYTLLVELSGVSLSDMELHMEGHSLILSGEKKVPCEISRESFQRTEGTYGPFRRIIHLPAHVDADSIDARITDGVLRITVQKRP
jgi:HSP20 family protein